VRTVVAFEQSPLAWPSLKRGTLRHRSADAATASAYLGRGHAAILTAVLSKGKVPVRKNSLSRRGRENARSPSVGMPAGG